jgi:hypothetical protein
MLPAGREMPLKIHEHRVLACLNFMSKLYCLVNNGLEHMMHFGDIGEMLEDYIEHMQRLKKIEVVH